MLLFVLFDSLRPINSGAGEAQTRGPSVSCQEFYRNVTKNGPPPAHQQNAFIMGGGGGGGGGPDLLSPLWIHP